MITSITAELLDAFARMSFIQLCTSEPFSFVWLTCCYVRHVVCVCISVFVYYTACVQTTAGALVSVPGTIVVNYIVPLTLQQVPTPYYHGLRCAVECRLSQ